MVGSRGFGQGTNVDINLFDKWVGEFCLKGFHLVRDTRVTLPYVKISMLKVSNGVIVKLGDKSHKTAVEIEVVYPDWVERNERERRKLSEDFKEIIAFAMKEVELSREQTKEFTEFMRILTSPKPLRDYRAKGMVI